MQNKQEKLTYKAWHIYYAQRKRAGVEYTRDQFVKWFITKMNNTKLKRPEVARKNHSLPYSFKNIFLQEKVENIKERNCRVGNPGRNHKKVKATFLSTKGKRVQIFSSKVEAAKFFNISEKTVYNHCNSKFKTRFKYGKFVRENKHMTQVRLSWK